MVVKHMDLPIISGQFIKIMHYLQKSVEIPVGIVVYLFTDMWLNRKNVQPI